MFRCIWQSGSWGNCVRDSAPWGKDTRSEGIKTRAVFRISRGRPNLLDLIHDKEVQWIVNTTESTRSESSENACVLI